MPTNILKHAGFSSQSCSFAKTSSDMIKQDFLIRMIQQIISAIAEVILYRKPIQRKEWEEYNGIARQILGFPVELLKIMNIKDVLEQYKNDNEQMDKIELAAMLLLKISDETDSDSASKAKFRQDGTSLLEYVQQHGHTYSLQREILIKILKTIN